MTCKNILIIEDEPEIRETLKQLLEFEGYQVDTASNGKEGVDALVDSVSKPHLILLDLMMPIMNGWEFLEVHSSNDAISKIPVVIVSAAGERAKTAKAAAYVPKPIDIDALLNAIGLYCLPTPAA